jgi:CarD family transcriptional regulator
MAKITKAKTKAKKPVGAKPVPVKKTATAIKVTVQGKTAVKVAPPVVAAPKAAAPAVKAPAKAPASAAAPAKTKAPEAAPPAPRKPEKLDFAAGDFVVYPAHGVGLVEGVETTLIAGTEITLYTICFEKDRMRLKLPVSKVKSSGLRKLSSKDRLKDALGTLQGRSQVRRVMWSRRAQEYEAKINSGDPVAIAEVLRDLRKDTDEAEQSYSERQIYQAALERLAREVAAIEKIDEKKAAEKLEAVLSNVA